MKMNPNIANLKKRKLLPGAAEDLELPSAKHIRCETVADSEYDEYDISCMSSMVPEDDVSVVDTQADSTQDAQSEKVDASVENTNSYDEASTVSDHSGSSSSGNGSVSFGSSSIIGNKKDGKEAQQCHNEDTSWHDIDGLEECMSTQYCHDTGEPTAGVLHDFLSSSGVDPNIYVLSSEILGVDQETPPGRSKPTIDQEFEQYFSMLML